MDIDNKEKIDEIISMLQPLQPDPALLPETSPEASLSIDNNSFEILNSIAKAQDKNELTKQLELFNLNQTKKNAARIIKLENLLDRVENEVQNRFEKRSDNMSNREVIDYMNAISNQIDRSQKRVDIVTGDDLPQQTTIVTGETKYNINLGTEITRDNKENVVDAIKSIIGLLQSTDEVSEDNSETVFEVIDEDNKKD